MGMEKLALMCEVVIERYIKMEHVKVKEELKWPRIRRV